MKESCCQFGPLGQLAGILTEPDAPAPRVALVLVSAGLSPKCGPFRLYAELARRLAIIMHAMLRHGTSFAAAASAARAAEHLARLQAVEKPFRPRWSR